MRRSNIRVGRSAPVTPGAFSSTPVRDQPLRQSVRIPLTALIDLAGCAGSSPELLSPGASAPGSSPAVATAGAPGAAVENAQVLVTQVIC